MLAEQGWTVRLGLLGDVESLKGDAALMAGRWTGDVEQFSPAVLEDADLVVDAIFGAGLSGDIDGAAGYDGGDHLIVVGEVLRAVAANPASCVAIDMPSGISGDTGKVCGYAASATLTVTFFRGKPGHWLMPGRSLRGELVVTDIGIPEAVLTEIKPQTFLNDLSLWRDIFPLPLAVGNKFTRGHVVVDSGGVSTTGAARLAATAALRAGAGLVTVSCPKSSLLVHASHLTAVMVQACESLEEFEIFLPQRKHNAIVLGPGNGVSDRTRERVLAALGSDLACVLDADALSSFADDPQTLFDAVDGPCILTPHDGEFNRLFGEVESNTVVNKLERARAAAETSMAVVIHKGPDTVITAPDGRAAINSNATGWLATAGSGDVLAGFAGAMMAQGMPAWEAACTAVWMHGECARAFGPGLIAEDLPGMVPAVLRSLAADP